MTAGTEQPKKAQRERRIIERPRLIKLLDECQARVILLLAPAGYGKTTLARQWAKTLNGAVWVTLTPAHRDVARFAEDVAAGIDSLGGNASRFIGEYVRARSNPQRAAREIGARTRGADRCRARAVARSRRLPRGQRVARAGRADLGDRGPLEGAAARSRPACARPGRRSGASSMARSTRSTETAGDGRGRVEARARPPARISTRSCARPRAGPRCSRSPPAPAGSACRAARCRPSCTPIIAEELYQSVPETLRQQLLRLALAPELTQDAMSELLGDDGDKRDRARRARSGSSRPTRPSSFIRSFGTSCCRSSQRIRRRRIWFAARC